MKNKYGRLFYPGGMFAKRVGRIILIYSIGFNLYLNDVQDYLLLKGADMIEKSETIAQKAQYAAGIGQQVVGAMDTLSNNAIYIWLDQELGLTQTRNVIESNINTISDYCQFLEQYGSSFMNVSSVIRFTSTIFWIPITIALLWLLFDARFGRFRSFIRFCLLLAIPINTAVYVYLTGHFPIEELPAMIIGDVERTISHY